MKKCAPLLILLLALAISGAWAQQYSAGTQYRSQELTPQTGSERAPGETLKPVPTGVIYEMSEKGFVIISPTAPASEGIGQRFLSAAPVSNDSNQNRQQSPVDFGGIKLIGFEF